MRNLRFDKGFVSQRLKANRENHKKIYDEAVEGYQKKGLAALQEKLEKLQTNPIENLYINLHVPSNHLKEYDRAILMVDQSLDVEVELSEEDYSKYIQDNWNWTRDFLTSNSSYSGTAASGCLSL